MEGETGSGIPLAVVMIVQNVGTGHRIRTFAGRDVRENPDSAKISPCRLPLPDGAGQPEVP